MPPRKRAPARKTDAKSHWCQAFAHYLRSECHLSDNTVQAYRRDLDRFFTWLGRRRLEQLDIVTISDYPGWLVAEGLAPASVRRHITPLRVFFRYLQLETVLTDNPAELLGTPAIWQRIPHVLSPSQVERLLTVGKDGVGEYIVAANSFLCSEHYTGNITTAIRVDHRSKIRQAANRLSRDSDSIPVIRPGQEAGIGWTSRDSDRVGYGEVDEIPDLGHIIHDAR